MRKKRIKRMKRRKVQRGLSILYRSGEEYALPNIEFDLLLLVAHPRHESQGHPPGPQFFGIATTTTQVRQVVARVGVAQGSALWVEDGVEAGYKHIRGDVDN